MNPALISRGYKGEWEKKGGVLSDGKNISGTWRESGDEPFMVARRLPRIGIFIGKNRKRSCERAKKAGFALAILDDGFQHRKLHRNLDIVLFDPMEKKALRESISGLRRARIILMNENIPIHVINQIKKQFPNAKVFSFSIANKGFFAYPDDRIVPTEHLKGKKLVAVCGIAQPRRYSALLEKEGIGPVRTLAFPDHHSYPDSTRKKITAAVQKAGADAVITTEKDVFKLDDLVKTGKIPVYYNQIDMQVKEPFTRKMLSLAKEM
jgi:tetraacyldisaccharide 4'-kinase